MQKSVLLSGSEVEYRALSEAFEVLMFVIQLLESMKIVVKYPVTIRVDIVGAIFMTSNITTRCNTKHMVVRYKCVNEYNEDGVV